MNRAIVIGLEVHIQLATQTKIFSGSSTKFGTKENSQASPVDLALPGTLPVINIEAINQALIFGLSTGSKINSRNVFARKNYFYPDLPKGYQITQHHAPILIGGEIPIERADGSTKTIRIHHSHLEEDAGKSIHSLQGKTGIDLNRAGQPLLEVVSMPDMYSVEDAIAYLKKLHHLVMYIGICDGNMQEGSFRCDANISLRADESAPFGTRVEIKNLNSFKFIEKALKYEIKRQNLQLDKNEPITQETRLYNEATEQTRSMRKKEDSHDYRYFSEPDLPTLIIDDKYIESFKNKMPELPAARVERYINTYELSEYDAKVLVSQRDIANYFDSVINTNSSLSPKLVANWIIGQLLSLINKAQIQFIDFPVPFSDFCVLIDRIQSNEISQTAGKTVLEQLWAQQGSVDDIISKNNLSQISDPDVLNNMIDEVIANSQSQYEAYMSGKTKLFGYFVGQVMKASHGKANPKLLNELLTKKLGNPV